ncbi:TPA: SycD/LcrH family type III secretion system chaperone [Salmonella enterica subsp. enterica serovar Frintrop]|nr:CesD/SycD/LcrH family type III secretion system chaperone [Salmonella enterica subsp. enterica]EDT6893108.1 CesD/SycD/LcrH family type III secretion system chaperone [Salmonella enterica subsp. enterica serovar Javiana]EED2931462.1 CesD/SycD/LcrH family type III secretion system chaperone [Salmonella enterica subsp. enterica serovar Javiana]MIY24140.1 CesD/SycD/LcrH family type III secretion system chaperone [Salmonella enterica subsp. enterica]
MTQSEKFSIKSYSNNLIKAIQNGATLKDLNGISDDAMQEIYSLAYDCYQTGKFNDALVLFRFLYIYDFYNHEYALGIGAVLQIQKKYSKAIDFYALAYSLSECDFRPMFYTGECNLLLGKQSQAKKCFEIVAENAKDASLVEKATIYLTSLVEKDV